MVNYKKIALTLGILLSFLSFGFAQENTECLSAPVSFSEEQNIELLNNSSLNSLITDDFTKEYLVVEFVDDGCAQSIVLANDHNGNQDFIDRTSGVSTCDYLTVVASGSLSVWLDKIGENSYVGEKSKEIIQQNYSTIPTLYGATPITDVTKVVIVDRNGNMVSTKVGALPSSFYDLCISELECSGENTPLGIDEGGNEGSTSCQYIEEEIDTDTEIPEEKIDPEEPNENPGDTEGNGSNGEGSGGETAGGSDGGCASGKCTPTGVTDGSTDGGQTGGSEGGSDSGCASGMCDPTGSSSSSGTDSSGGSNSGGDSSDTGGSTGGEDGGSNTTGGDEGGSETTGGTSQEGSNRLGRLQVQIPRETERDIVTNNDTINTENSKKSYRTIVKLISQWVWIILGLILFMVILYAGISLLLSRGKPDKFKEALNMLLYAGVGLGVALLAYTIVTLLINIF